MHRPSRPGPRPHRPAVLAGRGPVGRFVVVSVLMRLLLAVLRQQRGEAVLDLLGRVRGVARPRITVPTASPMTLRISGAATPTGPTSVSPSVCAFVSAAFHCLSVSVLSVAV